MPKVLYKTIIGGRTHTKLRGNDGETYYDPPLPDTPAQKAARDRAFQEMLRDQSPPAIDTDKQYVNSITKHDPFDGSETWRHAAREGYKRKMGHYPPRDAHYNPFQADFCGDPKAWLPAGEGRGYMKKLAEAKGVPLLDAEGAVVHQPAKPKEVRDVVKQPRVKLAKDIVDREIASRLRKEPGLLDKKGKRKRAKALRELREAVVDHHAIK